MRGKNPNMLIWAYNAVFGIKQIMLQVGKIATDNAQNLTYQKKKHGLFGLMLGYKVVKIYFRASWLVLTCLLSSHSH